MAYLLGLFTGLSDANALVSTVTIALGAFVVAAPDRAARIWGAQRLEKLSPGRRASFINWYRVFGVFLLLAGVLFAADNILSFYSP